MKNKKVLVTGGAGFVGYHLVGHLLELGASVRVIDDLSRSGQRPKHKGAQYFRHSVRDVDLCELHFDWADEVYNLAARVAGVITNQSAHLAMYANNIHELAMPVLMAETSGVERFLQVSSVCVYSEQSLMTGADETLGHVGTPAVANKGYSAVKRMGETLMSWSTIPCWVIVRPTNIAGPYDYFDRHAHVIPALVRRLATEDPVTVYGNPNIVREFIHPADVARSMVAVMEYGACGDVYNLAAPVNRITLLDLVMLIQQKLGVQRTVKWSDKYDSGDAVRRVSGDKFREHMPEDYAYSRIPIEYIVEETIEYYQSTIAGND